MRAKTVISKPSVSTRAKYSKALQGNTDGIAEEIEHYRQFLAQTKGAIPIHEAMALRSIGNDYQILGDTAKAEDVGQRLKKDHAALF